MNPSSLIPNYLHKGDAAWLSELLQLYIQHQGRKYWQLQVSILEANHRYWIGSKFELACKELEQMFFPTSTKSCQKPSNLRLECYQLMEQFRQQHDDQQAKGLVIKKLCKNHQLFPKDLEAHLYLDIKQERIVKIPEKVLGVEELIYLLNLSLIKGLITKSTFIYIKMTGNSLKVIRRVRWMGLLFQCQSQGGWFILKIYGPLSFLRKTSLYGHRLSNLLSCLEMCEDFTIKAVTIDTNRQQSFVIQKSDPYLKNAKVDSFDSQIEERFHQQFLKKTQDWDLIREPQPLEALGNKRVFPDFLIRHRRHKECFFYLEIAGFWTPEYISQKISDYGTLKQDNVIFCLKESRYYNANDLKPIKHVIEFKTRIRVEEVLEVMHGLL